MRPSAWSKRWKPSRSTRTCALAQLAKVNSAEAEIKRLHLDLWIRCNAQLRPLQRKQAVELAAKDKARGPKPMFQ